MMLPLLVFGALTLTMQNALASGPEIQAVLAVVFGAPLLVAVLCAAVSSKPAAILGLPQYTLFRILRAYYTLESHLSISLERGAEDRSSKRERREVTSIAEVPIAA